MAADIKIMAEEIIKTRARLNEVYAQHTMRVSASLSGGVQVCLRGVA